MSFSGLTSFLKTSRLKYNWAPSNYNWNPRDFQSASSWSRLCRSSTTGDPSPFTTRQDSLVFYDHQGHDATPTTGSPFTRTASSTSLTRDLRSHRLQHHLPPGQLSLLYSSGTWGHTDYVNTTRQDNLDYFTHQGHEVTPTTASPFTTR